MNIFFTEITHCKYFHDGFAFLFGGCREIIVMAAPLACSIYLAKFDPINPVPPPSIIFEE